MDTRIIENSISEASRRIEAEEAVLKDLVNILMQENLLEIADRGRITETWPGTSSVQPLELIQGECFFYLPLAEGQSILFRVKRHRFIRPYTISRLPVLLLTEKRGKVAFEELAPIELVKALADYATEEQRLNDLPNLGDFLSELGDSIQHTALSREAAESLDTEFVEESASAFLRTEQISSLRDRPFHPTSRAKRGWNSEEYRMYSPEFGRAFGLDWVAVRRDYAQLGDEAQDAASLILRDEEKRELETSLRAAGLSKEDYIPLPVHPWQMEHELTDQFKAEIRKGIIVPIVRGLGSFRATSSVRALSTAGGSRYHVKVPLGIYSLGALRILPPRYLHNGEKGQRLLQQAIDRDAWLKNRLFLCSESSWWGFFDPEADPFDDKPGHLACLVRKYPRHLLEDSKVRLIPMSALAVLDSQGRVPVLDEWLASRYGTRYGHAQVLSVFLEICQQFISSMLQCFRFGMMPEVHGQNVMVIVRSGDTAGLLLRDHDTIRLYLPWLEREGLDNPGYIVKPGTPNSLINRSAEQLLSYFQTLGVQVNLYAIMDAISQAYSMDEAVLWKVIRATIQSCLASMDFPKEVWDTISGQLLDSPMWPTRTLIRPLLQRSGSGGGSMPAGSGETNNPLYGI